MWTTQQAEPAVHSIKQNGSTRDRAGTSQPFHRQYAVDRRSNLRSHRLSNGPPALSIACGASYLAIVDGSRPLVPVNVALSKVAPWMFAFVKSASVR